MAQREAEITGAATTEEIDLTGQVALVTGAGRGIGRAIAIALRDAGAAVAVCARSKEEISAASEELATAGGQARAFSVDVSDRGAVERMIAQVEHELGPVDLLVNNAAVGGPIALFEAIDPDEWWRAIEVNVRGTLYCTRAVLPQMVERGHGRIVNVSSGAGFAKWPMVSSYVVSKAALYRLTETLDAETRERGVRMFAINPGAVLTRMFEYGMTSGEPSVENVFRGVVDAGLLTPIEQPARMVVYLASGKADALSGRSLDVNDDLPEMVIHAAEIERQDLYAMRQTRPPDDRWRLADGSAAALLFADLAVEGPR
jgi:NAD(P)-dependent dehydrogenase (short-subunit alcohol dehydrogenase family)